MRATLSLVAGLLAYFAASVGGAQAQDAQWTLVESTGPVFVAQPLQAPRFVSLQEKVAPGSTLTTGGTGRAVVRRGTQAITIGPNSRIALPAADASGMTKVIQDFGAAMFKVDKRGVQHFEVDTPMIAAVVKGTTFTVSVGANNHSVHVLDGLVQVSAHNGGAGVLVPAGVTALVSVSNPGTIRLVDPSTGVGDSRRGQPLDLAPADSSERRADAPSTGVVASLAVPQTIGAAPLDFERLSEGVIKSSITSSTPATVQTIDARGVQTEVLKTDANSNALVDAQADVLRSANNENSAVSSVLAEGKANPIDSIKSGGVVETTIASVGADVSPVINVLPVASPVENGNGNPIISVLPVVENPVENGNGDVSLTPPAIAVGNENGNPVVSVMQSGSPLDGALANPNDNGILGAILSRLPLGK